MDEFTRRFKAAKSARSDRIDEDGYEVYKFCFNGREDEWLGKRGRNREPAEIFADVVATVAEEFHGDLFNTMFPENSPWVEYEAGVAVPEDAAEEVKTIIEAREGIISKSLSSSNFYDEGPTAFQDTVLGIAAIWSDRHHLNAPINWEAVPASELYIRLGPFGIDDRFREQKFYYADLPALFENANFPKSISDKIKKGGNTKAKVIRGFWTDWTDPGNPVWVQRVRVDDKEIGLDQDLEGPGSCPLVVGRYAAEPRSPWGRGPARRMLPTLRTLDELVRMNLEAMDHKLDPAIVYPNDGFLDLSEGIEAGIGYPAAPGTAENIKELGGGELDYGFFTEERIEERVREGFYRDPMQRGKTPPSASQYIGEEQKTTRRMSRPAGKLWKEFGVGVVQRTEWLETQSGGALQGVDPITVEGKAVTLRPISPLERAQAREEVLTAQSILGIAVENLGPEQAALVINGPKTIGNIKEKMKDTIVEVRTEKELKELMQTAMSAQGGENVPQ